MKDIRIWAAETRLWTGDRDAYDTQFADTCLMVVPADPFILEGTQASDAMAQSPRWTDVALENPHLTRPTRGTIILAYHAVARREGAADYLAHCTTVWRRFAKGDWRVIQHQQTSQITRAAG